jgi:enoyl-CoA hydratase/carnithine racemase
MDMPYETFVVDRDGAVATVWFNRPEILNPINEVVMRELLAITAELERDEDTRVVILTGSCRTRPSSGPRAPAAGSWTTGSASTR